MAVADEKPPVPRERPMSPDEMTEWLLDWDRQGMSEESRREWEFFERAPEHEKERARDRMYRRHFDDLRRQQQPERLMDAAKGTREADI